LELRTRAGNRKPLIRKISEADTNLSSNEKRVRVSSQRAQTPLRGPETIDSRVLSTREINSRIKKILAKGAKRITVINPDARHNLCVGVIMPGSITFEGSVGYYCCSFCDGIDVLVEGNTGWGFGDNLMSGRIVVKKDVGASAAASMRGGEMVVFGNAGARAGISMKGGDLVIVGNSGFLTGFMMQKGRIIVLGDVGDAAGDSMYEGVVYAGGDIGSLGADAKVESVDELEEADLVSTLTRLKVPRDAYPSKFRKIVSAKRLYHYDSLEPLERERFVI
jgi:methylamine---glutamate N-methyltransferase subunit B